MYADYDKIIIENVHPDIMDVECFGIYNLTKKRGRFAMPIKVLDVDYQSRTVTYEFYSWNSSRYLTAVVDADEFCAKTTFSKIVGEPLDKYVEERNE